MMENENALPLRVLFVCTRNSARSQLAEALLRHMSGGRIEVFSAGSEPAESVHPLVGEVVGELTRSELMKAHPKPLSRFAGERFDYVITLCDSAAEQCPSFPGQPLRIHWGFSDPASAPAEDQAKALRRTAAEIQGRLRLWLSLPAVAKRI